MKRKITLYFWSRFDTPLSNIFTVLVACYHALMSFLKEFFVIATFARMWLVCILENLHDPSFAISIVQVLGSLVGSM
jgi:hypothetical protein